MTTTLSHNQMIAYEHELDCLRTAAHEQGFTAIGARIFVSSAGQPGVRFKLFHRDDDNACEPVRVTGATVGQAFELAHSALPAAMDAVREEMEDA